MSRTASFAGLALSLLMLLLAPAAHAVTPDEVLSDPALEVRARTLSRELRCMVCQNQSIDDSDAPLARDLRILVRERLQAGDSDKQVLDFLTARYGEFVLLRPRISPNTVVLWLTPVLVLLVGIGAIIVFLRRGRAARTAQLSPTEQSRVSEILQRSE